MEVALLGGTGDIGEGLALRWAQDTDYTVIVGSRDPEKADAAVETYRDRLSTAGTDADIGAASNEAAARDASVVVLSIPPQFVVDTVEAVASELDDGDVVVSPAVQMNRSKSGFSYDPPGNGSVAERIESAVPDGVAVVGAFQNLAAGALSDLDNDLSADVVVTGDDPEAKSLVSSMAEEIQGLRALDGGPLANTALVESITPLLINLAMNNEGLHDLGVRFE
ncbi:NADPH-dependent F420 reductase [Haloprofundus halobius]|uniref:NADPH-dependent F420 reductase n=1 Tax=Haloprofundus halobius TaxID=2876194 RepID=UPI001CCD6C21|nr:NADPH-dependent F420 reductase [Haloprofundus halobius]